MLTQHHAHSQADSAYAPQEASTTGDILLPFLAMGLGVIILAQDFSSVNVALPAIERDLDSTFSTVQWVINAYALVFAMLIVAGGRFADLFGRKRIFFVGAIIFSICSLIGGFVPNVYVLIGARAVMGVGGALMWPAILGMTYALVPKEKAGLAGGLIIGAAGVGQVIGPILGGALTELISWRWTLFVNIPIAAFAMLVTYYKIHPATQPPANPKIDWAGIVTLSLGLFLLLFALDQAPVWGWTDPRLWGLLVIAAASFALFIFLQRRVGENALVPGDMMGNQRFRTACIVIGLIAALFVASLLYVSQYLEKLLGASPLYAGLGFCFSSVTTAGVSAVEAERTSLAGGLIYMFQIAGGAVGLGLTTTVVYLTSDAYLARELEALGANVTLAQTIAMRGVLAGTQTAQEVVTQVAPQLAAPIITAANDAFVAGI